MADAIFREITNVEKAVREQLLADHDWRHLPDGVFRILSRISSRCLKDELAGWLELTDARSSDLKLDVCYLSREGGMVAIEFETNSIGASHSLLKLVHFAGHVPVQSKGIGNYVGVIVTSDTGPGQREQSTFQRLLRRIPAMKSNPITGRAFKSVNLAVIGVDPTGATNSTCYPRTRDDSE